MTDDMPYFRYTGPMRMDKAVHTLEGILKGISIDGEINAREFAFLEEWLAENLAAARRHPFNELVPRLEEALSDGVLDPEEQADLLWLCRKLTTGNAYFDAVTADMQRLQAVLAAISADGVITVDELEGLRAWLKDHAHLRTCWPYEELEALLTGVLADGRIDGREHAVLMNFFREFMAMADDRILAEIPVKHPDATVTGICAVSPDIEFSGRTFCFTGKSARATRKDLAQIVTDHGGRFSKTMNRQVDYLIIGAAGNPCWAYACYGRKVETAVAYRKEGIPVMLVHENDFWNTVDDRI